MGFLPRIERWREWPFERLPGRHPGTLWPCSGRETSPDWIQILLPYCCLCFSRTGIFLVLKASDEGAFAIRSGAVIDGRAVGAGRPVFPHSGMIVVVIA